MAQVSKRPLNMEVEERIYMLMDDVLSQCATGDEAKLFMRELLTETELTVLAKRLAIALMLTKGLTYNQIDQLLKVSPPTVFKVKDWMRYKGEGFKDLLLKVVESGEGTGAWTGILEIMKEQGMKKSQVAPMEPETDI